jgi:endonuclease YncB( thermonuclease family)
VKIHSVRTIRSLSRSAFAVGFLVLLLANTVLGQQSVIHGRVVGVTDGDTIKVLVAGQRLLRIATPHECSVIQMRYD